MLVGLWFSNLGLFYLTTVIVVPVDSRNFVERFIEFKRDDKQLIYIDTVCRQSYCYLKQKSTYWKEFILWMYLKENIVAYLFCKNISSMYNEFT